MFFVKRCLLSPAKIVFVVIPLLFACDTGSNNKPEDGPTKISERLFKRVFVNDGGAEILHGIWDNKTNTNCSFTTAEDGKLRCLPLEDNMSTASSVPGGFVLNLGYSGSLVYQDNACTVPMRKEAANKTFNAVLAREIGSIGGTCDTTQHMFAYRIHRDQEIVPEKYYVLSPSTGDCVEKIANTGSQFFAASKVPAAGFVQGEGVREQKSGDLDVEVIVAEDGSRWPRQLFDRARDQSCASPRFGDESHCLPSDGPVGRSAGIFGLPLLRQYYGDNQCTKPLTRATNKAAECMPKIDVETGDKPRFFEIKAVSAHYSDEYADQAGCVGPYTDWLSAQWSGYRGDSMLFTMRNREIAIEQFPKVVIKQSGPGDKVKAEQIFLPDGETALLPPRSFVNTEKGERCGPALIEGTTSYQCAPPPLNAVDGYHANSFYIDDVCTKNVWKVTETLYQRGDIIAWSQRGVGRNPAISLVHRIVSEHPVGSAVYRKQSVPTGNGSQEQCVLQPLENTGEPNPDVTPGRFVFVEEVAPDYPNLELKNLMP